MITGCGDGKTVNARARAHTHTNTKTHIFAMATVFRLRWSLYEILRNENADSKFSVIYGNWFCKWTETEEKIN